VDALSINLLFYKGRILVFVSLWQGGRRIEHAALTSFQKRRRTLALMRFRPSRKEWEKFAIAGILQFDQSGCTMNMMDSVTCAASVRFQKQQYPSTMLDTHRIPDPLVRRQIQTLKRVALAI